MQSTHFQKSTVLAFKSTVQKYRLKGISNMLKQYESLTNKFELQMYLNNLGTKTRTHTDRTITFTHHTKECMDRTSNKKS